jgi:uncharacterized membrane-anchored protein
VWLRTAPVDPRDLFRGDYVQLEYDIGAPSAEVVAPVQEAWESKYSVVYAQLATDAGGIAKLQSLSVEPPTDGLFIRGRMGSGLPRNWRSGSSVQCGIEKYFVPQGAGYEIENRRGERDGWQTPMEVEVALSSTGTAVIKDYRWSGLGIRLDRLEEGQNNRNNTDTSQRRSPRLRVSLRNQTDKPLLLVDDAHHCAFSLVQIDRSNDGGNQSIPWAAHACHAWQLGALEYVVLAPEAIYSVEFDFAAPEWAVQGKEGPVELADFNQGWVQYRLVYSPPDVALPAGKLAVWQSAMQTPAFGSSGRVD